MNEFINSEGSILDYFDDLLKHGLSHIIQNNRDKLLLQDNSYKKDAHYRSELENSYSKLTLNNYEQSIIDAYITQILITEARSSDLSYLAGFCDALRLYLLCL